MPSLLTRGCSPHGTVRETRVPTGRTIGAQLCNGPKRDTALRTAGGQIVTGYFPVLLVKVKQSRRPRRSFEHFCRDYGLRATVPDMGQQGGYTVFEVTGPGDALDALSVEWFVSHWEQPIDAKPPRDRYALGDSSKQRPNAPTVVKLFGGRVAVISCKGVSYGRA
jgi:hypothetical protein